ncbi:serine/threonine-protein kinase [Deinococcus multiflagellatus]|uniref:Serine/threonine-protein kinase n=1 Tax=Deinococcus multiflagellatus TaxID=1656887 RepID=A0ABW1ZLH6_9DEIO|nr:serine/threonine-protein kinase [Deinococcus multiflagellatus]MBZ9714760.1 serine/threonine protein kinase [Deinococcus multiflagellatus]
MSEDRTIPGYTLHRVIGRGNTSLVWLATDARKKEVALKVPLPETLRVQEAAERFGNEVRLTLKFRHPHLVPGYAGTPFGPKAFLAIPYYSRGALSELLPQLPSGTLPLPEALRVLADVASALTYLHHQGAVHQDVKPQNVYVDEQGRAALGDLGSAYFTAQGGQASGSPFYMSPEVYHGETSSAASDVYSLGITMYELLGGERPYHGNTYEELMVAHLTRFPAPLLSLNPKVSRRVARLAELALAKRPHDRPTADAIRRALLSALGETPADEVYEDPDQEKEAAPVPARQMGRHGPQSETRPQTPEPATAPEASGKESRWSLFKRRK